MLKQYSGTQNRRCTQKTRQNLNIRGMAGFFLTRKKKQKKRSITMLNPISSPLEPQ